MSDIAHLDFETFSELDIRKVGGYRYARHQSTEVLIACYKLPGMLDVAVWLPREEDPPEDLIEYVASGGKIGAHNAAFERVIWKHVLRRMHPTTPEIKDVQWICTAAKAAACGLPRSLEKALKALQAKVMKDEEGAKLIKVFCQPKKPSARDPRTRILPEQDQRFQRFVQYCQQDVRGEYVLDELLPDLIPRQRRMFLLDMLMNDRGLPIDLPLVKKALVVVKELEEDIAKQVATLTGGLKATQVAKMLEMFEARGIELANMQKATIVAALKNEDLDDTTRALLELRVEAGKASTKKLVSMLACADPNDWIVQGGFLLYGAHTGRYAGRLVQPHNFIRGLLKDKQRELIFKLLDSYSADVFKLLYERPIDAISQCMRGFIRAPEGHELAVVDYTAIEARVLAWVAGEEEQLEAFRRGLDVYKVMAVKLYKLKSVNEVEDEQRRIAKNLVLGCGYQLGGPKFVDYAANAGVVISEDFAKSAVKAYRDSVPNIVASWGKVEKLVALALRNHGETYEGLKCKFHTRPMPVKGEVWLCIELPSGREIRYPYAKAVPCERWGKPAYEISFRTEIKGQWVKEKTYGGKLIENIVQAVAFDIMQEGMLSAEVNGYPVIGTVHDELLTLRKKGTSCVKELEKLVCTIPRWSTGIPLAAKGFICDRYKKD